MIRACIVATWLLASPVLSQDTAKQAASPGAAPDVDAETPRPETPPPEPRAANPFARGTFKLSILVGMGVAFGDNYLIVGAGPGYYLIDGLVLDVTAEAWFVGNPGIGKFTPGLTYVLHFVPVLKPYVGGFYRYTVVEHPYSNVGSLGVRFGAYYVSSPRLALGLGAVYEHYLDSDLDPSWYPEASVGIAF